MRYLSMFAFIIGTILFAACDTQDPGDCLCTEEFISIGVYVVDADRKPVEGVRIVVTVPRTGDTLEFAGYPSHNGYYSIADDRMTESLPVDGEWLQMKGEKDTLRFDQAFFISTGPCRCHVEKLFGPDTVTLK
ncbi:MAG: hypothetical protein WC824_12920 [Bacteroidota bacterium]|jgi:hypothetical protein